MKVANEIILKISEDFSSTPGPRYEHEGEYSGEVFRRTVLKQQIERAIREKVTLLVDLDGTAGYGTSFLEEAFGGLIRVDGYDMATLNNIIRFISNEEPYLIDDIKSYINDAADEK